MQSINLLRQRLPSILLLTMLSAAVSACTSAPPVFLNASPCSTLVPDDWASVGIESAPLPVDKTVGGWGDFAVQQTGQLDKANRRTADAIKIVSQCEARDKAVEQSLQPKPWWHIW